VAAPVATRVSSTVTRVVTRTLTAVTPPLPGPLGSAVQGVAGGLPPSPATVPSLPILPAPAVRAGPAAPVAAAPRTAPLAAATPPATFHAGQSSARAWTFPSGPFAAPAHADSAAAPWLPGRLPVPLPGVPGGLASIAGSGAGAFSPPATALLTPLLVLVTLLVAHAVVRSLRPSMHASRIRRPG